MLQQEPFQAGARTLSGYYDVASAREHLRNHMLSSVEAYTWSLAMSARQALIPASPLYETLIAHPSDRVARQQRSDQLFDNLPKNLWPSQLYSAHTLLICDAVTQADALGWTVQEGDERIWFGLSGLFVCATMQSSGWRIRTAFFPRRAHARSRANPDPFAPAALVRDVLGARDALDPAYLHPVLPRPDDPPAPLLYRHAFMIAWQTVSGQWPSASQRLRSGADPHERCVARAKERLHKIIQSSDIELEPSWSSLYRQHTQG